MRINNNNNNNNNTNNNTSKALIINILKCTILHNLINYGWTIKQIDYKTYEFTKKIDNFADFDLYDFIHKLVN
jgi:hypothetical protein